MVQFQTDIDRVSEVQQAISAMFAALAEAGPPGVTYAAFQVAGQPAFILMLDLCDGIQNPLPGVPEAAEFRGRLPVWAGAPVTPQPLVTLGHYRA